MGLLYFEVEADYQKLIELRQQIAGLEKQMTEAGLNGAKALEPLEKEYARLSALQDQMLSKASSNAHNIQSVYTQMGSVSTGLRNRTEDTAKSSAKAGRAMADGMVEAESAAQVFNDTLGGLNAGLGKTLNMMSGLGSTIGTAFGVGAIGMFINKVQEVRSYFQDIESSMRVFLGDAEKADKFTQELKSYAFYNMFEFSELAQGAKQLIAYGNATEKVIPIMDKLSNVATGTGASLNELIHLYNKAKSTGTVMSQDVQSWAAKGVILRDELRAMGQEASTGAITFSQLNQVLEKVTGEGGRFHNLMMEQMNNLSAAKGQLQDNIDAMYNEIGERLEPLLKGAIDKASWLVDNYEAVGKAILTLATTYGIYRTTLGIINAIDREREIRLKAVQSVLNGEAKDIATATATIRGETKERMANVRAIEAEIAAKKQAMAMDVRKMTARIGNIDSELSKLDAERSGLKQKAEMIGQGTAKEKLTRNERRYNELLQERDDLTGKVKDVTEALTEADKLEGEAMDSVTGSTVLLTNAKKKLVAVSSTLGKVLGSAYFWIAAAVAAAVVATYNFVTAETAEEKAVRKVAEWQEEYNKATEKRVETSNSLITAIKDETKSLYEQANAYERLLELYPELQKYTKQELKAMDMGEFQGMIDELEMERAAKAYEDNIKSLESKIKELEKRIAANSALDEVNNRPVVHTMPGVNESQAQLPLNRMFPSLFGEEWDAAERKLENYRAELKEMQEERDRQFKERERQQAMSNLDAEERIEVLEKEKDAAQNNFQIYDKLYNNLKDVRGKDTAILEKEKQVRMKALEDERDILLKNYQIAEEADRTIGSEETAKALADARSAWDSFMDDYEGFMKAKDADPEYFSMFGNVDNQIKDLEKKWKDAESKIRNATGKEKIILQSRFEADSKLLERLRKVRNTLQAFMDQNPLKIAFGDKYDTDDIENWKDLTGKQQREIRRFIKARQAIIDDAVLSDEEKKDKLEGLYLNTQSNLTDLLGTDDTSKAYLALSNFIRKLGDDRRNGIAIMEEGVTGAVDKIMGADAEVISAEFRNAEQEYSKATADYGNLWTKIKTANEALSKAEAEYRKLDEQYRSGKVSAEEYKQKKDAYDTELKNYNELIKEARKYENERETMRRLAVRKEREQQDRLNSIRENEISLMREGTDKSIAQIRLEFKKRGQEIERGYEDIKDKRMQAAKEAFNAQAYKKGQFSETDFLANFQYDPEDIELKNAQMSANVMDYIRKMDALTKEYQTEAEKKADERRKREEDILAIEKTIEEIRANMTEDTKEEGERAIENLKGRLELAKQLREALDFNDSRNDYFLKYGSAFMRREAVNARYDNLIGQEQDEWRRRGLEEERQKELSQIAVDELKKNLDWAGALEELGGEFADYARRIYEEADLYTQSEDFRKQSAEEQKAFLDMLAQVRENMTLSLADLDFVALGRSLNGYREKTEAAIRAEEKRVSAEKDYKALLDSLNAATEEELENRLALLEAERDDLMKRQKAGGLSDTEQKRLNELNGTIPKVALGLDGVRRASVHLTEATKESEQAQVNADAARGDAASRLQNATVMIQNWAGGLQTLLNADSLTDIFNGLSQFITNLGGKWGGIIGAVLSIADDLIASFAGDDWMLDKNQRNFRKLAESTSEYIEAQEQVIDMLLDMADEGSVTERAQIYGDINDRINKDIDKLREEALAYGNVNRRTWWQTQLKGTDTINEEIADWKNEDFNTLMRAVGMGELDKKSQYLNPAKAVPAANDALARLYNMDAEGIRRFMRDYTDIYSKLPEEVQGYLTRLLGMLDKADETVKDLNESMLHITFDDMYSSFVSKMKDMKTTAYDTAGDISEIFFNAMMENRFASAYKSRISQLYEDMSKDLEATSESEMEGRVTYWQGKYNDIVSEALKERDRIAQLTGYDQAYAANQASSRGFQAMSQDVGNELNGRFTALQIEGERIRGYQETQTEGLLPALGTKVDTLIGLIGGDAGNPISHVISDVQTTLNNSYLELQAINANTGSMLEFWAKNGQLRNMLDEIRRNTAKIK